VEVYEVRGFKVDKVVAVVAVVAVVVVAVVGKGFTLELEFRVADEF
jgi:hypothetical protein